MSERWQRELLKLRTAELPDELWDRALEGPHLAQLGPAPQRRIAAAAVAIALVGVAAVVLWKGFTPTGNLNRLGGSRVHPVPPRGGVAPVFLSDGHPVFIVHHEDGEVSVVDAFSTHRPWGIEELVGWCPSSRTFDEPAHGAMYDEFGTYVGGPAPSGLATISFDVIERDAEGLPKRIRAGELRPGRPKGDAASNFEPDGSFCRGPDAIEVVGLQAHHIPPSVVWKSPANLAESGTSAWNAVRGTLLIERDGFVRLCQAVVGGECRRGAVVRGIDGVGLAEDVLIPSGTSPYRRPSVVYLARVREGVLVGVTLTVPGSTASSG